VLPVTLLPQQIFLEHHCEICLSGCKGPFCWRQVEHVGKEAAIGGVTHFETDEIPLRWSMQFPIPLAQRDSLPHQTKFEDTQAAHVASCLAGHCQSS
jgi:hypothetical protein